MTSDNGSVVDTRARALGAPETCPQDAGLTELSAELRRMAEERDALRRLADERAAALEALDRLEEEFIAVASHDLRGPLTAIIGYAQFLNRYVGGSAPDLGQVADGLVQIHIRATAMARMLDDLLDVSRIQAGAFEPRTAPCDLGACLVTVLDRLSVDEHERIDVTPADAPLAGQWEQTRIEQVLANLVDNALKYSPAGGQVSLVVVRDLAEIEVAVSDRGMGIPAAELPRLFERFYRTPQAHASGLAGTGLGLYICRGIIAAHGGRLWAESPGEGRGATFRFTLPAPPIL